MLLGGFWHLRLEAMLTNRRPGKELGGPPFPSGPLAQIEQLCAAMLTYMDDWLPSQTPATATTTSSTTLTATRQIVVYGAEAATWFEVGGAGTVLLVITCLFTRLKCGVDSLIRAEWAQVL
jgi:hypothetical protein